MIDYVHYFEDSLLVVAKQRLINTVQHQPSKALEVQQ
jgi:hypothetical protein